MKDKKTRLGGTSRAFIDCINRFLLFNDYSILESRRQTIIARCDQLNIIEKKAANKDILHPEFYELLKDPVILSIKNELLEIQMEDSE